MPCSCGGVSREHMLKHVTLEEYILANGGIGSFLEGLGEFWRRQGFDMKPLRDMAQDADHKARLFRDLV